MKKLCIVRRRKPESPTWFRLAESAYTGAKRYNGSRRPSDVVLERNYPLHEGLTGADDHKISIELTPTQADAVKSHGCFKVLEGGQAAASSEGVQHQQYSDGITFNFFFKQVYLSKLLTVSDTCEMLQVSKAFLARLVRTGILKSHKMGRRRRFSFEDVLAYLRRTAEVWEKGGNNVF